MISAEIGESLLAAILDDPTDDARRLIYADWLEDEGQHDRTEFIRAQIAGKLIQARLTWLSPFEKILGVMPHQCRRWSTLGEAVVQSPTSSLIFRRGFADEICCPLRAWLDHGPAIVARHPVARIETLRRPYIGTGVYWWFRGNSRNEHELPEEVFVALTGQDATAGKIVNTFRGTGGLPSGKGYDSAADALDALSDALLALARSQVVPAGAETVS